MNYTVPSAIEAVWRAEAAKIIASVARMVRDVGLAEDLAQEALVAALEHWPASGVPNNPGAWLMATAKNRALDQLRRHKMLAAKHEQIGHELDAQEALIDLLRLIFTACHPVLSAEARVALTLKMLGGLSTAEIARAFLVSESTLAQRIVRAKRTLSEARVPFELPRGDALGERLASVLEVIYLIFNEGYTATEGADWVRQDLCQEALRLGRVLAGLAPNEPEVHGLLALMELQASRLPARVDAQGRPVLLNDQDRRLWDELLIRRGLGSLERVQALGGQRGPYALQAAIAACHAQAARPEDTDWRRIAGLYEILSEVQPSPVVELNRAVAVAMAEGPEAGLAVVDRLLRTDQSLRAYHWLPSVRGDLLARLGRNEEARRAFEDAAALARNERERDLLLERARSLSAVGPH
jgi:RNA polymerase sigma factor (sigma-70 family)